VNGVETEALLRQSGVVDCTCDAQRREVGTRLALLDAFQLSCDDEVVPLSLPAERLLAFLALRDRPVRRVSVACTPWIDTTEDHAFGSLRSALWSLRRSGHDLVEAISGRRLRLAPGIVIDVREATASARRLLDCSADAQDIGLDRALLAGDLLPDWYDDWVVIERERFRQLRVRALEFLCERLTAAGRFSEAIEAGLGAVTHEPLRESAHRVLIRTHLAEGNRADALRQYRIFRQLLHDCLGLEPSGEIEALVAALRS